MYGFHPLHIIVHDENVTNAATTAVAMPIGTPVGGCPAEADAHPPLAKRSLSGNVVSWGSAVVASAVGAPIPSSMQRHGGSEYSRQTNAYPNAGAGGDGAAVTVEAVPVSVNVA